MTYSTTKFEVVTSNGLGGDTFTRNVTDGHTHGQTDGRTDRRTDGRRTDFDTKLIYPFFLKKKAGIISVYHNANPLINWYAFTCDVTEHQLAHFINLSFGKL